MRVNRLLTLAGAVVLGAGIAVSQAPVRKHQHGPRLVNAAPKKPGAAVTITVPDDLTTQVRELQGLAIAPVPLDMTGKNSQMVGLGSYLVNAGAGCNDCHTSPAYTATGNPFMGMPKKVNAAAYLGG